MNDHQSPLWLIKDLVAAIGGQLDGDAIGEAGLTGISIDTRTILPGDLFVALKDQRDGHEFVTSAFEKGAGAALVCLDYEHKPGEGVLIRVEDPLRALEKMAIAARARLSSNARLVAVTGSAGKTTTKEMLRACFASVGAVHASEKSYNNHWGVPLTLARMPSDTAFAVIEIGMNHAEEIRPLTKLARPHIAVITTIAAAHLGHFESLEAIAEAKAEIFEGLEPDGFALLPRDVPQFDLLACRAQQQGGMKILGFGELDGAERGVSEINLSPGGSKAVLKFGFSEELAYEVGIPGRHNVLNAAACLSAFMLAIEGVKIPSGEKHEAVLAGALEALRTLEINPVGRGQVVELAKGASRLTLIDESYNANPASMRAALETLSLYPRERRRIAVLGDMLELGDQADELHVALKEPLMEAGIDRVYVCGRHMKKLHDALPAELRAGYAPDSKGLSEIVLKGVEAHDIIMIKGSLGSGMKTVVDALKTKYKSDASGAPGSS